mgnify:CR=1 FL=1
MSADNYLAVRHNPEFYKPWEVLEGNASSEIEHRRSGHMTRDEAIDVANEILSSEIVEYGLSEIEKEQL